MKTIIQVSDYPIDDIYSSIKGGAKIERHNALYGYDAFIEAGYKVIPVCNKKRTFFSSIINYIGRKFGFLNTYTQLLAFWKAMTNKDVKLIYCHILQFASFLSFLRRIGVLRIPVLCISHDVLSEETTKLEVWNGIDKVVCLGERTMDLCVAKANIPERHRQYINWGADLKFTRQYKQETPPTRDFFIATGVANRDYELLIDVFRDLPDLKLIIYSSNCNIIDLPSNVVIDRNMSRSSMSKLLYGYYNAIASLIPLKKQLDFCNGATILYESMAMSCPVIVTNAKANLLDAEKEGIGLNVPFGDKSAWKKSLLKMAEDMDFRNKCSQKCAELANSIYNYDLFCKELIDIVDKVIEH